MEIEYNLTFEDIMAFNRYHHANSPTIQAQRLKGMLVVPACILLLYGIVIALSDMPAWTAEKLWFIPCVAIFYVLVYPRTFKKAVEKNVRLVLEEGSNKGVLGWHKVSLNADMITETTEYRQTSVKWEAIEKVVRGDGYLYVYHSSITAVVIPEGAFPNQDAFIAFTGKAQDFYSAKQTQ